MKITIDSCLIVENPSFEMMTYCKTHLVVDNPDYIKKERMGKWTGGTPAEIQLYERMGNRLYIPFGVWDIDFYKRFKPQCKAIESRISPLRKVFYGSTIKPYDYQEKAISAALNAKNGILVMPCGAGKTQTALEIISRIGGRALWLTHTQDLLNQSMNRAKSVLNIPPSGIGTITGGKVNVSDYITFATVQTMSRIDLAKYKDFWDVVIVDECQHCCGSPTRVSQFYKVMSRLCARFKFGLTATPKRADGLEVAMFGLLGRVIHEVPREEVENTTCKVYVEYVETGYEPDLDIALAGDGTLNYAGLVDDLTHDKERFSLVNDTICNLTREGRNPIIVLANRVEYLQRLAEHFTGRGICLSAMGTSKAAKNARKDALQKLENGELDCVFATYQLAKEGLDVPSLRYIVFATPEKDDVTVTQAAGRVARKSDKKPYGVIIDFVDSFGMLRNWKKKRERIYKKLDFRIDTGEGL